MFWRWNLQDLPPHWIWGVREREEPRMTQDMWPKYLGDVDAQPTRGTAVRRADMVQGNRGSIFSMLGVRYMLEI